MRDGAAGSAATLSPAGCGCQRKIRFRYLSFYNSENHLLQDGEYVRYANAFASCAGRFAAAAKAQQRLLRVRRDQRAVLGQDVATAKAAAMGQHRAVLAQQ